MRVLAVDDDAEVALIARLNFELDGHEFHWAPDAEIAGELVQTVSPDVVLLDSMIPPDGGLVILTRFRLPHTARIPVIMFTAETRADHLLEGLYAGAVTYVTKPFDPQELVNQTITIASLDEVGRARIRRDAIADLGG